jgi:molecular chaperone DnaK (HSP70)
VRLGIDFGTTRTVVACCDRGNYPLVSFLDGGEVAEWFPSALACKDGEWRHGFDALRASADPGWTLLRSFKRLLASGDAATRSIDVGGTSTTALELATRYLTALREALLGASNLPAGLDRSRLEAVIAAPANAHGTQRFLTMEAFRRAGFEVVAMLNEPSAAGFEYTHRHRATLNSRRDAIVVYDLGGGTFDASLIRAQGRHHEVVATSGVNHLGGDDFDEILAHLVLAQRGQTVKDLPPGRWPRLLERCREAKESLSPNTRKLHVDLESVLGAGDVVVSVADFYAGCAPLVEETLVGMAPILSSADEERDDAVASLAEVAGIYVVGGASALPLVGRALRERFGRRVHRSPYPFAATALGLAIAADAAAGFSLRDLLSRHFGVFREGDEGRAITFDSILGRDVVLPAPGEPPLTLRRVYRAAHNVGHYRFAECASVDGHGVPSGDLTPVGQVWFPFDPALRGAGGLAEVPVVRRTGGPLVQEEYTVEPSGLVSVTIRDLESGYSREFRLE